MVLDHAGLLSQPHRADGGGLLTARIGIVAATPRRVVAPWYANLVAEGDTGQSGLNTK